VKGKYANAAEKRRALEALERRAADAERAREKAEVALRSETERMSAEISRLKDQLRAVTAERDAGQGPEIAKLQAQNKHLLDNLAAERDDNRAYRECFNVIATAFRDHLRKVDGLSQEEAAEIIFGSLPAKHRETLGPSKDRPRDSRGRPLLKYEAQENVRRAATSFALAVNGEPEPGRLHHEGHPPAPCVKLVHHP
jgi:hypothetical protein